MAKEIAKSKQRQGALNKAYYKEQFFKTEKNKTKKLVRHLRNFPNDTQAIRQAQEKKFKPETFGMTSRGARRADGWGRRRSTRAKRRAIARAAKKAS